MSIADKLTTIAENQQRIFEAGKMKEQNNFWDSFQDNGNRNDYRYAFAYDGWNDDNYSPKHDIVISGASAAQYAYGYITALTDTKVNIMFEIGTDGKSDANYMFYRADSLETITEITFDETTTFNNTFYRDSNLKRMIVNGTIGQNGFNVQWASLDNESLESIVQALKDYSEDASGTTWLITLGATNAGRLTTSQQEEINRKGWNVN